MAKYQSISGDFVWAKTTWSTSGSWYTGLLSANEMAAPEPEVTFSVGETVRNKVNDSLGIIVSIIAGTWSTIYTVQSLGSTFSWSTTASTLSKLDGPPPPRAPSPGNILYSQPLPLP